MYTKTLNLFKLNHINLVNLYVKGVERTIKPFGGLNINSFKSNIFEKSCNYKVAINSLRKYQISYTKYMDFKYSTLNFGRSIKLIGLSGIFSFFKTEEDEKESELITLIKRSILMTQRDDLNGAEQMLHLALKLAQEQQNPDAITYVYDLLANVAFTKGEFDKAEKLFVEVMKRVLSTGTAQNDPKIIHMSLKLAKIYEQRKDYLKAEEGYKFCTDTLEKLEPKDVDEDTLLLWAISLDWYARFLHDRNRLDEAFNLYKKAYDMCVQLNGEIHEQTVILLNDLGTISFLRGDNDDAIMYMTKAVETGKHLPNMEDFSSVYVNLGNIYIKKKLYSEAKKSCKEGWQNAKRHKNDEGLKEASICLDELRNILGE